MPSNPLIKILAILLSVIVLGIIILSRFTSDAAVPKNVIQEAQLADDKASGDTPFETLKTLTAEITRLSEQNQKMIAQNTLSVEQDKNTLSAFKNELLSKVQEEIEQLKVETKKLIADDQEAAREALAEENEKHLTVVNDKEERDETKNTDDEKEADLNLSDLLPEGAVAESKKMLEQVIPDQTKTAIPYFTIPVNATMTGVIAMQPIIGRIPISGKVPDPYTFKVIIGPKNLTANGINTPVDLQGIVASGIAEGDLLGRCARGDIRSMTFVFADGRISTTEAKDGQVLGTIAALNGNPCIQGSVYSDAPLFLAGSASVAGLQGYGNALSQSQLNTSVNTNAESLTSLISDANRFAAGQGLSTATQAMQKWWDERVESSFDFVYVPHVDPKTGKQLKLNINITQEIAIDYDLNKRKVFYAHDSNQILPDLD